MDRAPKDYVDLLDISTDESGRHILLDGEGNKLGTGCPPVFLRFKRGEEQRNSRGEPMRPAYDFGQPDEERTVITVTCQACGLRGLFEIRAGDTPPQYWVCSCEYETEIWDQFNPGLPADPDVPTIWGGGTDAK